MAGSAGESCKGIAGRLNGAALAPEPAANQSGSVPTRQETGFLVTADVSGYTEFLTGSELDHAHDIMRGVMRVLTRALGFPFRVVKYEGDALLCFAPASDAASGLLLDVLEGAYVEFSDHAFNMKTCTTCTCKACGNMQRLDLKIFLHHGSFMVEQTGKAVDLAGPDVILLHRLMKNHVRQRAGVDAYLLATRAALERIGMPTGFADHNESYEHFGEVPCGVLDLRTSLAQRRESREVRVTRKDAQVVLDRAVPAEPSAVWDAYFEPSRRVAWDTELTSVRNTLNGRGRAGVGATMHCAHGSFAIVGTTLDWKPFRYFTQEHVPATGGLMAPALLVTVETEALTDGGTRVTELFRASGRRPWDRWLVALGHESIGRERLQGLDRLAMVLSQ